jgi:outer membrane protein TolC
MIPLVFAATLTLSLDDAVSTGLKRNIAYRTAIAQAQGLHGTLVAAQSQRYPQIDVEDEHQTLSARSVPTLAFPVPNGSGGFTMQTIQLAAPTTDTLGATASLVLFRGGAIGGSIGEATAQYAASIATAQATRADVIARVTEAYFTLAAARADDEVQAQALDVAHQNVLLAQKRVDAGAAPRAYLLQQQLSEANARTNKIDADNAVALGNAALLDVLDLEAGTSVVPTESLERSYPSFALDRLRAQAREQRPELRAAQSAVDAAEYAIRVASATNLPSVAVSATESNTRPALAGAGQPQLVATLLATWRLFDGGLTRGNVMTAQAGVAEAELQLEGLRKNIDLDVEQSYDDYQAALARIDAAASAKAIAAENARVAKLRFANGVGTALELSDATVQDTQAQSGYIRAQARARIALATLLRAAGAL